MGRHLAVEWTYQGAEAASRTAARAVPADDNGVSGPFARKLYELAMIGDVRALTARLDELELEGAVSPAGAVALRALVRNFDMKGVRRYLEPSGEVRA